MQDYNNLINVLIVEDNPGDAFLLEEMLRSARLNIGQIMVADRISKVHVVLEKEKVDVILLDLSLTELNAINSVEEVTAITKNLPLVILRGLHHTAAVDSSLKQSELEYLYKHELSSSLLTKSVEYSIKAKRAEEKIFQSEEKYRQIFNNNPMPSWIYDVNTLQILEINKAAADKYGFERHEFLELTISDLWCYDDLPPEKNLWDGSDIIPGQMPKNLWKHKTFTGNIIIVEGYYYPVNYFGKPAMQMQVNDVTEKMMLEKEITLKRKQIIEAGFRAQENERKAIGEELHDNINQILATVMLFLDASLKEENDKELFITKGLAYIKMAISEIRKLSKQLVMPNLREFSLRKNIVELIENIGMASRIRIELDLEHLNEASLSEEHKINIYRIVQEQLNNIIRHSAATTATINVNTINNYVNLLITDNGIGYDTTKRREGIGINNIISRAELFNGKVEIDSSDGNGCLLKVILREKMEFPQRAA